MRSCLIKNVITFVAFLLVVLCVLYGCETKGMHNTNVNQLIDMNLDGRLMPHRMNDLNSIEYIFKNNIRSFEIDLLFRSIDEESYFEVGHHVETATGVRFEVVLKLIQPYQPKKIWLDIKNISESNIDAVLLELKKLDSLFDIKSIVLVESSTTTGRFSKLSSAGFHTSYYLPTDQLLDLMEENVPVKLVDQADKLRLQLRHQSVNAVSFDIRLYPFVKKYLENAIPETIIYHTWNPKQLWNSLSLKELQTTDYWKDDRVKTILYKYRKPRDADQ